jgi:hypothetical protein
VAFGEWVWSTPIDYVTTTIKRDPKVFHARRCVNKLAGPLFVSESVTIEILSPLCIMQCVFSCRLPAPHISIRYFTFPSGSCRPSGTSHFHPVLHISKRTMSLLVKPIFGRTTTSTHLSNENCINSCVAAELSIALIFFFSDTFFRTFQEIRQR